MASKGTCDNKSPDLSPKQQFANDQHFSDHSNVREMLPHQASTYALPSEIQMYPRRLPARVHAVSADLEGEDKAELFPIAKRGLVL